MKTIRYNFNKYAKMNLLCPKDGLRPVLACIYFDEGNAIASDGYVMLVTPVSEISNLSDEDIEKLNGKLIDCNDYKDLLKFDVIKVESDGIVGIAKTGAETKCLFRDYHYPNYKAYLEAKKAKNDPMKISDKERIKRLEHQLKYVEQENRFLKKNIWIDQMQDTP